MSSENKTCQNCKQLFVIDTEDFEYYNTIKVPPPTFCFDCRTQRKIAFANRRNLYQRTCDKCKKAIFSMYRKDSEWTVYCTECYRNKEDCTIYGRGYDFSKPFFAQILDLYKKVPQVSLNHNATSKKCTYSNYVYHVQNVYLSYMISRSEDILYSQEVLMGNKVVLDSQNVLSNERGYELVNASSNYNSRFLVRSNNCIDSAFLLNCSNCTNCFMSVNLKHKEYVWKNEQLTREEYLLRVSEHPLGSYAVQEKLKKEFCDLARHAIYRFAVMKKTENCTGDYIENSKNVHWAFNTINTEDSKYIVFGANTIRHSYDLVFDGILESCYEAMDVGGGSNTVRFALGQSASHHVSYCIRGKNNADLFGCIGLDNKQYCILNKQYTKEEYEALVSKVIEHMNSMPYSDKGGRIYRYGEFFPIELSPFAYNESYAYEEFPLSKEHVLQAGFAWRETEEKRYETTIDSDKLSDSIADVTDSVLEHVIACPNKGKVETKCTYGYKIVQEELRHYHLMNIPLPRLCPNCRYFERRKWLNPWKLWHRRCMNAGCTNEFETTYAPDRQERVYCETCYQNEL